MSLPAMAMAARAADAAPARAPVLEKPVLNTVYQKALTARVLRCGSFADAPFTTVDEKTGNRRGIAVELAEKLGSSFGLGISWAETDTPSVLATDVNAEKIDVICASLSPGAAANLAYTLPYAYVPVYGYARAAAPRNLNAPDVTLAVSTGTEISAAVQKKFPQARLLPVENAAAALQAVADKKADAAFAPVTDYAAFTPLHKGVLQQLGGMPALYAYPVAFALKPGEAGLKYEMDNKLRQLIDSGEIDALLKKYDPAGGLLRPGDGEKANKKADG